MMLRFFSSLFFLFSVLYIQAQTWVEMMEDPQYTVDEVRNAYEEQWNTVPYARGQGHKQFERWAHWMERRVGKDGQRPVGSILWKEMSEYHQNTKKSGFFQGSWESLGPDDWVNHTSGYNPGLGRVNWIEIDPVNPQIIYLSTPSGGVWKSTNNGGTWVNLTDHLPVIGATGMAINHLNNQSLLIGTGDGYGSSTYSIGLLRSYDGGQSWDTTGLQFGVSQFVRISDVYFAPNDTSIIMVAASNGIYRSTDAGATWSQVSPTGNFRSMAYHPLNPSVVFAASNRVYKSEDGGATFREISTGLPNPNGTSRIALAVSPADSNRVYALLASSATQGLRGFYRSDNVAESFVLKLDTPNILAGDELGQNERGQGWYDLCIAVHPTNADHVFTGGVNIWRTFNGGDDFHIQSHWRFDNQNRPYVHADIHYLGYHGNMLYVGCDGGVFRTNTGGLTWEDISKGLEITQIYGIGLSRNFNNIIQFGSQDNGTNRLQGGIWKHIFGADGMHTIIHPIDPNIVYISTQYGNLRKSTDGGSTFIRLMQNINETGQWVTPYIMHPTNPDILYVGKDNVWRSINGGMTWSNIAQSSSKIRHIAQSQTNPNVMYYVNALSRPFISEDGGETWQMTTGFLPSSLPITDIKVSPNNPDVVYITYGGYFATSKVFKSEDRGQTWISLHEGLPNLPANVIAIQEGAKDRIYVGMDVGVYYYEDGMDGFIPFFDGMPNVIVNDLRIQYNIGRIRAGTYGRGVWESPLFHVNLSQENFSREANFKVFPNPAKAQVNLRVPEHSQVQLQNLDGSVLSEVQLQANIDFLWDLGVLPAGVYLLRFGTSRGIITKKLILH
jgi:photosystem II stability/assembly factor-like uncharacterized protein